MPFSRRSLLAGFAAASAAATLPTREAEASEGPSKNMTLIDLSKCDGCPHRETPACVTACRVENAHKFPKPDPSEIRDYWPQDKHEDWSKKRHLTDRLTPFNWLYVQKLEVDHEGRKVKMNVPRRCMHCDNPPCVKVCPFGVAKKDKDGPVHIDPKGCFGGAKCRTVCPWNVPQRQAGVGVYTYLDPMPVGGGVMYKCDMCRDRVAAGGQPACVEACPRGAMTFGPRDEIIARAKTLARRMKGHLYGLDENGGTATVYVSPVPFEKLDEAVVARTGGDKKKLAKTQRLHRPGSLLKKYDALGAGVLAAPVAGAALAFAVTVAAHDKKEKADKKKSEAKAAESDTQETK